MRLLYPIDLRHQEVWRLDEVAQWAAHLDATVDLLFVDPFGDVSHSMIDPKLVAQYQKDLGKIRDKDRVRLQELMDQLPEANRGEVRLATGEPAHTVNEVADEYEALLVSTHGRKGAARLWLGSVAERIVRGHAGVTIVLNAHKP